MKRPCQKRDPNSLSRGLLQIIGLPLLLLIPGFLFFQADYVTGHDARLSGPFAIGSLFISASASVYGIPVVAALMNWRYVAADTMDSTPALRRFTTVALILAVALGGGCVFE